ncbi:recombinase family protein [Inquilinus sp.]|uniref:recombinase family protein n=1 Tax=Inquilinus sp. TaxID=1932117 RepID=UPI0031D3D0AA
MPDATSAERPPRRAVQYLRMSSEHQRYSLERQAAVIAAYAGARGFEIVRTYADPGKSGLSLKGRKALQRLLADTLKADRDFNTILVLDVSRWGRFQDPDQAAHYEFICKQVGVQVAYCSEPFENDGSLASSVIKVIKRLMAGEFSRDLSARLMTAHLRHAQQGFIQGQSAPFGIRRQLVGHDGRPKQILLPGQRKALQGDRVQWILGPRSEIEIVRKIFDLYVNKKLSMLEIARRLSTMPQSSMFTWSDHRLRTILSNEIYIGNYIYNRTDNKLQGKTVKNDPSAWIRKAIVPGIVPKHQFAKAQEIRARAHFMRHTYSDNDLKKILRAILAKRGELSHTILLEEPDAPHPGTFAARFGSMELAFLSIGYVRNHFKRDANGNLWTDEAMLEGLRRLYRRDGYVSKESVTKCPDLPSYVAYSKRFGSVRLASARAGIPSLTPHQIGMIAASRSRAIKEGKPCLSFGADGRRIWKHFSSEQLVQLLGQLLDRYAYLSAELIDASPDLPSHATIANRFGSLPKAYEAVGWKGTRSEIVTESHKRRTPGQRQPQRLCP